MRRVFRNIVPTVVMAVMVTTCWGASNPGQPLLKSGDRMVFLGDSITQQRIYTRYVMNYFTMCQPGAKITFRNAGWDGDTAPGGLNRLKRDVLDLKPTVVSICFGMNDGGYNVFNPAGFDNYMKGMKGLVSHLKQAGVRVFLMTPGVVDYDRQEAFRKPDYNATLAKFSEGVMKLGKEENVPAFDLHTLMLDVQTRMKKDDPKYTFIPDSVHPDQNGHVVMAYALLKMLAPGGVPCTASLNAKRHTAKSINCKVTDIRSTPDSLTFTRSDRVLPAYLDPGVTTVLNYVPFYKDLCPYTLTVTGLKSGDWKLTVGDEPGTAPGLINSIEGRPVSVVGDHVVGTFTAAQLAAGVDLATMPGPWKKIGQDVNTLSQEQENLYINRWRSVSLAEIPAGKEQERADTLKKLDAEIDAKEALRVVDGAGVHTWNWELTRVP